ncbi:DUF4184 family protein [Brevibacillus reuszeri]|uniref:DUF4184 family protein n=1 Tax=Brevibacillus reuszeri TaxID=54915 RepID=UPI00289CFEB6|nr:DUF4184 family protein [Brevibacillus reuszeri]
MPFTFAHPAIVLPLRKSKWFSFTALVFGSMAPDFEYFFRMQPYSAYSHTLWGLIWFDVPLVLLLTLLYHAVVKRSLIACSPEWIGKGLSVACPGGWSLRSWKSVIVFGYSGLVGSLSHILWDAFTHQGAYFVEHLWFLQLPLSIGTIAIPVFKLLQHGSTSLGFIAIGYVLWREGRLLSMSFTKPVVATKIKWFFWIGIGCIGFLVAALYSLINKGSLLLTQPLVHIVPFLSGSLLGLVIMSWWMSSFVLKK